MKVLGTLMASIVVLALIALAFVYSDSYNVAATDPHAQILDARHHRPTYVIEGHAQSRLFSCSQRVQASKQIREETSK